MPPCLGRELYRAPSGVSRVRARARGLICVSDSCSSTAAGRRGGVLRLVGMTTARKVPCTLTPRALVGRMRTIPELRCFLHARLSLFECSVLDRFRFAVDRCLCSLRSTAAVSCWCLCCCLFSFHPHRVCVLIAGALCRIATTTRIVNASDSSNRPRTRRLSLQELLQPLRFTSSSATIPH